AVSIATAGHVTGNRLSTTRSFWTTPAGTRMPSVGVQMREGLQSDVDGNTFLGFFTAYASTGHAFDAGLRGNRVFLRRGPRFILSGAGQQLSQNYMIGSGGNDPNTGYCGLRQAREFGESCRCTARQCAAEPHATAEALQIASPTPSPPGTAAASVGP